MTKHASFILEVERNIAISKFKQSLKHQIVLIQRFHDYFEISCDSIRKTLNT